MSKSDEAGEYPLGGWSVIANHDWEGTATLETTLRHALDGLDGGSEGDVLYQYVDVEAVIDLLSPDRGASEVRFEYPGHEVRVAGDGTIAVR